MIKQSGLPYRSARLPTYGPNGPPSRSGPALSLLAKVRPGGRCHRNVGHQAAAADRRYKVSNSDASTGLFTLKLSCVMDIRYYIGIDIAKATLDWAVYDGKKVVLQTSTANSVPGIKTALRLLKGLPDWKPVEAVFCMEYTAPAARRHLQCSPA